jgi:hypothetical protein
MNIVCKLSPLLPLVFIFSLGCTTEVSTAGGGPLGSVDLPEQERIDPPSSNGGGGTTTGGDKTGSSATDPAQMFKLPAWQREDVQPKSARFGQSYGLDAYSGKTVVVVLLEGYCPYCQSNSVVAQNLQEELAAEKLDVQIVILGDPNAEQFASRVSLPIFKDRDKSAWYEMRTGASKHDTFVFAPNGERTYFWLGSYQGDATRWRADIGKAVRDVAKPLAQ